jgi:UDP-N-acetylglucosamine acyltransferase
MAQVHPTAIVQGDVVLAEDVSVGPMCVLDGTLGPIRVGPGTKLVGGAWLFGPLQVGTGNTIYPCVCLGFAPQSQGYDPARPGRGLVIGDNNTFREGTTVHRATSDHGPTVIGNRNFFMTNTHAGHDAHVADHCVLATGAVLGGHVVLEDRVTIGGNTAVHQFVRIGRGAMLSGGVAAPRDVPPFFMLTGVNVAGSINVVGMRRQKLPQEDFDDVRWAYKTLYRRGLPLSAALEVLRQQAQRAIIAEYVIFIERSKRGISPGHGQGLRNSLHAAADASD